MLASVASEVAVMAVDHSQAGAHVTREIEGRDACTKSESRERVPEIVDPSKRIDARGLLGGAPLERAEVVDVEVAAPLAGKQQRRAVALIRSSASSARVCSGTARMLASVFGILSSRRVNERRT